jgi:hypothetical protein
MIENRVLLLTQLDPPGMWPSAVGAPKKKVRELVSHTIHPAGGRRRLLLPRSLSLFFALISPFLFYLQGVLSSLIMICALLTHKRRWHDTALKQPAAGHTAAATGVL